MACSSSSFGLICLICVVYFASSAYGFGAGNIGSTSRIEGQNWRHGDIEDTLLTILMARAAGSKKFTKLDVKRVYFGNWLRDYSQAVDVGTVKHVSAEAIRVLLWILGFMSFGYGTKEFEVTTARLGCYRPEEHIDNPRNYADNEDARQYDRRLRAPVDERRELAIDEQTGMKNYIANERAGIDTSAGLVRDLFGRSIQLGRRYARSKNEDDLYEALRLLGTGCHCLEDFSAHSNYTELALIELGERDVFPHVGRRAQVHLRELRQPVYALCTGTFGGVDFLHSVMGEFDDKATQSEIQELENTMNQAQSSQANTSVLQDLLSKVPDGIFGGQNESQKVDDLKQNAQAHQMQNTRISPRQPEEWLKYINDVQKQIYPILEWHDNVMKSITETIDKIPILPDLLEQIQDQINVFVFSLLAPFIVPIINQVKAELNTGSNEIIQSSVAQQHIVFKDDDCSDPTHSMLSKDHFSNVLNEPAGKIASQVLKWIVPQLIACWDDERVDVDRTLTRTVDGVLHHPALRDYGQDDATDGRRLMFKVVQDWWREKSEREKDGLRDQLSRSGVQSGRNHKPGVVDHGHGGNRPLGMPTSNTAQSSSATGGPAASAVIGGLSEALGGRSSGDQKHSSGSNDGLGKIAGDAVGGGALGSIVGGLAGGLLGGAFGKDEKKSKKTEQYGQDGSHNQTYTEYGQSGNAYEQAQFSKTDVPGGRQEHYTRYEQNQGSSDGYESQRFSETSHFDRSGNQTYRHEEASSRTDYGSETQRYGSGAYPATSSYKKKDKSDDGSDDEYKKQKKREKKEKKEKKKKNKEYGHYSSDDDDSDDSYKNKHRSPDTHAGNQYGRQHGSGGEYGGQHTSRYGGGREPNYAEARRDDDYGSSRWTGGGGHERGTEYSGGHRRDEDNYGRDRRTGAYQGSTYGRESPSGYGGAAYGQGSDFSGGRRGDTVDFAGGREGSAYEGSTYGRESSSGYGSSNLHGQDTSSGYGSNTYGRDSSGYGGSSYGRESGVGGYGESRYEQQTPRRYGSGSGGDGGAGVYGAGHSYRGGQSGRHDGSGGYDNRGYGSSRGYGNESEQMPGGFGNDDDDNEGQRRRYNY